MTMYGDRTIHRALSVMAVSARGLHSCRTDERGATAPSHSAVATGVARCSAPPPWRAQSVGPEREAAAASLARDYFQWTTNAPVGLHHTPGASMMVTTACAFLCPLYALEEPPRREGREGLDAPDTPPQRRDPVQ